MLVTVTTDAIPIAMVPIAILRSFPARSFSLQIRRVGLVPSLSMIVS